MWKKYILTIPAVISRTCSTSIGYLSNTIYIIAKTKTDE